MKILDQNDNEIQPEDVDYRLGKLSDDKIFIQHHDAVEAVEEQGHYETLQEYPNGGKDVATIWDVEPTEARDAYDETEEIQRYHLYSDEELKQREEKKKESEEKENKLASLYNNDMTFADIVTAKSQTDSAITEIQVALADIYEQMLGGAN